MIFNRVFAAPGDNNNIVDAGGHALFDYVLNQGFVHHGQHFFGLSLGGWKESST